MDILFSCLCFTSELCSTSAVTDWTRSSHTPREGDFGSDWDSNHWHSPHDSMWRLSLSPLSHSQCQLQVLFRHYRLPQSYAGMENIYGAIKIAGGLSHKGPLSKQTTYQVMQTHTVPEHPLQLCCQTLALQDPPQISPTYLSRTAEFASLVPSLSIFYRPQISLIFIKHSSGFVMFIVNKLPQLLTEVLQAVHVTTGSICGHG